MSKKNKIKREDNLLSKRMDGNCPHQNPMPFPPCFQLPNGHFVLKVKRGFAFSRESKGKKRHVSGREEPDNKKKRRKNTVSQKGTVPQKRKLQSSDKEEVAHNKKKRASAQKKPTEEASSSTQLTEKSQAAYPSLKVKAPTSLNSLEFHRVLGRGGFGKVMLASDALTKQQFAVKMVQKKRLQGKNKEAVQIEKKVLEVAEGCRFLVHGFSSFETEKHLVYVMEYVCGGTLMKYLEAYSSLDSDTATLFAAEMACGLEYLHCNGVVHRDLKPANILIDGGGHIKIADFGLALINMFGNKTATGCAGTVGYMAPEMISGERYDSAVDWWALGVILYQMLIGEHPFQNGQGHRAVDRLVLPRWLSLKERDILAQLLSKTPSPRLVLAANIRSHPFFKSIDWNELEAGRIAPPLLQLYKLRV